LRIIIMRFRVTNEFAGEHEIERLRDQLEARFHTKVNVSGFDFDCRAFLDFNRNQHSSSAIIERLEQYLPTAACKILAITGSDLCIPVLTFVFGEARLNGQCAVLTSPASSSPSLTARAYELCDPAGHLEVQVLYRPDSDC
jgi:predicted Zn-dependent protease